ncbi:ABC transporter substrate-binding protein [Pelagovum pacificum]|uniref:ABC transporter substrate-binding protein n=1 Tax=Pelagovum pacificum TaxID=2588711 RepID=A0A5C5GBJ9_9RHOB|nr:ABC transporter substrate-binding protein [Pelagovum pacificum]QQA44706.1 ABC transporter substrate-binding protein [Pelagovum pacificum]TNY32185.1 ABC transporter substrate-binding protein [Pelagovum pacificum]
MADCKRRLGLFLAGATLAVASSPAMAQSFAPTPLDDDMVGSGPRLVYLHHEYPATLDPQNTSAFMGQLSMEFFDTLVTYAIDPETGIADQTDIVPRLADSWEISDDNTTLTFHLNPDATFWDGSPVTAEDVYWSIERALVGRMGWGTTQIETGGIFDVDQMEVVDDQTIVFTYPDGLGRYSLRNFASMSLTVMSKAACEAGREDGDEWCVDWIRSNAMGSGPYMLGDSQSGEYLIATANTDYWGEAKPYYAEVMFRVVPDPQTRMLLMDSGEASFASLTPNEYSVLEDSENVKVFSVPSQQDVAVLRWDPEYPPFDDPAIREAVIKAIPYDRIVTEVCAGFCTPVQNLVGVNTPGYEPNELFSRDIEAAQALVAESSYGEDVPSFEVPVVNGSTHMAAAVIIQDALREIGMEMEIRPLTQNAFDEIAWGQRDLDVSIHSMGPWWNDFMYWAYWMYRTDSATNHIQYSNATLDEDVLQALLIPQEDEAAYMELQNEVLDILVGDRLAAPLYQVNWSIAASSSVCNVNKFPWGSIAFSWLRPCE